MGVEIERVTPGEGLPGAQKWLNELQDLVVGVLSGTGEHTNSSSGQTVAEIAWWNEFGTARVRARPFLRPTIRENKLKLRNLIKRLYKLVATGKLSPSQAEKILAIRVQKLVQRKIVQLRTPANAPLTVALKGSSNPLVDTGELKNSISWDVVK